MSKERTIGDYLNTLPEPYRTQAIDNRDSSWNKGKVLADSLTDALDKAFDWGKTPEGEDYWMSALLAVT